MLSGSIEMHLESEQESIAFTPLEIWAQLFKTLLA